MELDAFLHHLHFNPNNESIRPGDFEIDWEDAPHTYKLYRGLPGFPLSADIPLTLKGNKKALMQPELDEVGHFLWYVYGLSQFSQHPFSWDGKEQAVNLIQIYRRFAPSGGALYPNELYVYLKLEKFPTGVYHYDVAHHRLLLLREGNFDIYLSRALGERCHLPACFGAVFVTTVFWKNFFKYNNFSYRLQGLDAGVVIGQLLEVAKRFGFHPAVYFQFLDMAINHLLGISEQEESAYAVIPLSIEPTYAWINGRKYSSEKSISAFDLSRELPYIRPQQLERSRNKKTFPMLVKLNQASMQESTRFFRQISSRHDDKVSGSMQSIILPYRKRLSYDLAASCRKRFSPEMNFVLEKVSLLELATLLHEATASFRYQNDLDGDENNPKPRVSLYGCFHHIAGIPDGAYRYHQDAHRLERIQIGDFRILLQAGMVASAVNLFQVPLCFHVAGRDDYFKRVLGYRGYRIQQMEIGMQVQRLLLTASALGMGGHPLLDYDVQSCDTLYHLGPRSETSFIQVPIGRYRPRPSLTGSLQK